MCYIKIKTRVTKETRRKSKNIPISEKKSSPTKKIEDRNKKIFKSELQEKM